MCKIITFNRIKVSIQINIINFFLQQCESPVAASFPTPPLSNSPSYSKRQFEALDLSGMKEEDEKTISASTQTAPNNSAWNRTCGHCNITFGDEMMHALHMSCHDKQDPFKCKVCGLCCNEKYFFNVHLLRGVHHRSESVGSAPDSSTEGFNETDSLRCPSNGSEMADNAVSDATTCH